MRKFLAATLVCLALVPAARTQEVKDPAELMPAGTLAYAELRHPGQLVKEIASLFEGSAFGNVPDSLTKLFPKEMPRHARQEMGAFGLVLAPEVIKEVSRIQGAAIALIGCKDPHSPEYLAVVLPGDSNAPGFMMRAFLTMEEFTSAGEVEGVKVYQYSPRRFKGEDKPRFKDEEKPRFKDRDEEKPRFKEERERPVAVQAESAPYPAVAMMPGALFVGSADAVKDAIRRAKGKGKGESLAESKLYKEVNKELGDKPGVVAYGDVSAVVGTLQKVLPQVERDAAQVLKAVDEFVNFKAFRAIGYAVTLDKGTLQYRELVLLDPKEKSPVLELLPQEAAKKELLHFTPNDTVLAAAISNDHGAERWTKFLKLMDAVAKVANANKMPSEEIAQMEKALELDFGKDIAGKVAAVAFALGDPLKAPMIREEKNLPGGGKETRSGPEIPFAIVVQATDEEAAATLVDKVLPKVIAAAAGEKKVVDPKVREIDGQKVSCYDANDRNWFCYGRAGKTIVLGQHAKPVAQALNNGAKEKGFLADPKVKARVKELDDSIAIFAAKPVSLVMMGMMTYSMAERSAVKERNRAIEEERKQRDKKEDRNEPKPREKKEEEQDEPKPRAKPDEKDPPRREKPEVEVGIPKELTKLLEKEELLIIRVTRKDDRILEVGTLPGLKPLVSEMVDFGMKYWMMQSGAEKGGKKGEFKEPKRSDDPPSEKK